jgi:M6 family metalloprotease-like protein
MPRGYYQPYDADTNPDGYQESIAAVSREQALVKEIVGQLAAQLGSDVTVDANADGLVDNLCLVFAGTSGPRASYLLWPHRSALQLQSVATLNGARVAEYLMLFDAGNGYSLGRPKAINTGVICHEMTHALGANDLYHTQSGLNPVGVWDLMSDNLDTPQGMSAYTKQHYLGWIDSIPQIREAGVYTLNPVGGTSGEGTAYRIKPTGSDEYFVVEYRSTASGADAQLPGSGLLVWRVNPKASGNSGYNGTDRFDELYLFRPGGTTTADGTIRQAFFSSESGRTAFGGDAEQKPFYTDGREAPFALTNIGEAGATLSFELLALPPQIWLADSALTLSSKAGNALQLRMEADVAWEVTDVPSWLTVSPLSGEKGEATLTFAAATDNLDALRSATLTVRSTADASLSKQLTVRQPSAAIGAPRSLTAVADSAGFVSLAWRAPLAGIAAYQTSFETDPAAEGWTIRNTSPSGWSQYAATKYVTAISGSYVMYLKDDWNENHQDEWLISPLLSNVEELQFWSKSVAPGKTNAYNGYEVLASADGGTTWNSAWNLMTESTSTNKYELVKLDLTPWLSDSMRVAFRGYDTNVAGHTYLSYTWTIDDLALYGSAAGDVSGYIVYCDGVAIGETAGTTFVDNTASEGTHRYSVSARSSRGETELSDEAEVTLTATALQAVGASGKARVISSNGIIRVVAPRPMAAVQLYDTTGVLTASATVGNALGVDLYSLPSGLYLLRIAYTDGSAVTLKFIHK